MDIGGNTGIYTVKAAKFLEASRGIVVVVEPFPEMLAMLSRNLRINGFTNVRTPWILSGRNRWYGGFVDELSPPRIFQPRSSR